MQYSGFISLLFELTGRAMKPPSNQPSQPDGLTATQARFPAHSTEIQRLFDVDETFRGICDDLAAAENTLRNIDQVPDHVREARRDEYADLVSDLSGEIQQALARLKVISMPRKPRS
jgi:hypothetical protein